MPKFESILCIDYSASSKPTLGKDSIWIGGRLRGKEILENFPTRHLLHLWLSEVLDHHISLGSRLLAGFDFAFGYPRGFADALGLKGRPWEAIWALFYDEIQDAPTNANNRFEVAQRFNRRLGDQAPFWGRPKHLNLPDLPARKQVTYDKGLSEWRLFERLSRGQRRGGAMQSGWKLAYTGAVGSQSLMGIARLEGHRRELGENLAIWPFEGSDALLVFAEVYPSGFAFDHINHPIKDARQVLATAAAMQGPALSQWLDLAQFNNDPSICEEEGWLLSFGSEVALS